MRIGQYEVRRVIGRGGMGIVYETIQPSLNRLVALKVLPPEAEHDAVAVNSFWHDGQIAASLRHPNIVQVFEASLQQPPYYIAMEYLSRGDLRARLNDPSQPLPVREARAILNQIAAALDHAHSSRIVHRDVKPENIMFNAQGRAVLVDFGSVDVGGRHGGVLMGTPSYMSPEQAGRREVDYRSDVYSLAVVFWEMLVGYLPFTGGNEAIIAKIAAGEAPPAPSKLRKGIPRKLDAVFAKAFALSPAQRYGRASEFAAAVGRVLPFEARLGPVVLPAPPAPAPAPPPVPVPAPAPAPELPVKEPREPRGAAPRPAPRESGVTDKRAAAAGSAAVPRTVWRRIALVASLAAVLVLTGVVLANRMGGEGGSGGAGGGAGSAAPPALVEVPPVVGLLSKDARSKLQGAHLEIVPAGDGSIVKSQVPAAGEKVTEASKVTVELGEPEPAAPTSPPAATPSAPAATTGRTKAVAPPRAEPEAPRRVRPPRPKPEPTTTAAPAPAPKPKPKPEPKPTPKPEPPPPDDL